MIDEKKLDNLARVMALAAMKIFKADPYCTEERALARDIWMHGIIIEEEKKEKNT